MLIGSMFPHDNVAWHTRIALVLAFLCGSAFRVTAQDSDGWHMRVQPPPKRMSFEGAPLPLPQPLSVCIGDAPSTFQRTAARLLRQDLARRLHTVVSDTDEAPEAPETGTRIELAVTTAAMPAEGYVIRDVIRDGLRVLRVESRDHGLIYGALTLMEILFQGSPLNDLQPAAPANLSVEDHPSIRWRVTGGNAAFLQQTEEEFLQDGLMAQRTRLELAARRRSNMMSINVSLHEPMRNLERMVAEARTYGIGLEWRLSYIYDLRDQRKTAREFCPLDPDNRAEMVRLVTYGAQSGVQALSFYFDDISDHDVRHVLDCAACREHFDGNLGRFQRYLLGTMARIGRDHGVDVLIACPTLYIQGSHGRYRKYDVHNWNAADGPFADYFKELTDDPALSHLFAFSCEIDPATIRAEENAGLRNYAYFMNGPWTTTRFFGHYTGLTRLGWTLLCLDYTSAGPAPIPEAVDQLKNLHHLTDMIYFGTGSHEGLMLGGFWAWDPERYHDDHARAVVSDQSYGPGVFAHLQIFEHHMMALVEHYKTYTGACPHTFRPLGAPLPMQSSEFSAAPLDTVETHLAQARRAFEAIERLMPETKTFTVYPRRRYLLGATRSSIRFFEDRLEQGRKMAGLAATEPARVRPDTATPEVAGWWRFDTDAIEDDSSPHGHDLTIHGAPQPVDGVFGRGLYLHGGRVWTTEDRLGKMREGVREYLEAPVDNIFEFREGDSFTVELWVDIGQMHFQQFLGTRPSMTYGRHERGWALGMNYNEIIFIVDSGASKRRGTRAHIHLTQTRFDRGSWNYIVGVRDADTGEARLYVNGQCVVRSEDKTADLSGAGPVRIGFDPAAGTFLKAYIDEVKITRAVVPAEEIEHRYLHGLRKFWR